MTAVDPDLNYSTSAINAVRTDAAPRWISKTVAGGPAALYGPADTEALFSIRCDPGAEQLVLTRSMRVMDEAVIDMVIDVGGESRAVTAIARQDPLPQVIGRLNATDALAADLLRAKAGFAVVVNGVRLDLPASPAVREVVDRCA